MASKQTLERGWYRDNWLTLLLTPLSWLYSAVSRGRRRTLSKAAEHQELPVPVIVVGNISVGGTGKTPLLITLVAALREAGFRPGVISRGYGGKAPQYPLLVTGTTSPSQGGDEPVLIADQCQCPVVVDPDRLQAARHLLTHTDCDLILSDDGLQHYRLPRDIEIAVVDGNRGFGNKRVLPAGPLREPVSRLKEVDFVVCNGEPADHVKNDLSGVSTTVMDVAPLHQLRPLVEDGRDAISAADWPTPRKEVNAVAGIGNPQRFVDSLQELGLVAHLKSFPDHHDYQVEDLQFTPQRPVVMTAKDAVKCRSLMSAEADCWVLDVVARLPQEWLQSLISKVKLIS